MVAQADLTGSIAEWAGAIPLNALPAVGSGHKSELEITHGKLLHRDLLHP
jgi:hypothetical protein